jgi:hypothetical protein
MQKNSPGHSHPRPQVKWVRPAVGPYLGSWTADPVTETHMLPDDDLTVSGSECRFRVDAVLATGPPSSSARNRRRADISKGTPPAGSRHRVAGSTHASRGKSLSNQRWSGHCREGGMSDIALSPATTNTVSPRI